VVLHLAVSVEHDLWLVSDVAVYVLKRDVELQPTNRLVTDRHTTTTYTALAWHRVVKINSFTPLATTARHVTAVQTRSLKASRLTTVYDISRSIQ